MVGPGIEEQTAQMFDNLEAILTEAGSGLDRIVKTTVFLASLDDFQGMNAVYAERVGETPPARSTIEVARAPVGRARRDRGDRARLTGPCGPGRSGQLAAGTRRPPPRCDRIGKGAHVWHGSAPDSCQ